MSLQNIFNEVSKEQKFIKLIENSSFTGMLKSVSEPYKNQFGTTVDLTFVINGTEKTLSRLIKDKKGEVTSTRFWNALQAQNVKEGDTIQIRTIGKGFDVKYDVMNLSAIKPSSDKSQYETSGDIPTISQDTPPTEDAFQDEPWKRA